MPAAPHLMLEGLRRRFGTSMAVDDLSLSVERGSFVALLGPSGCGKTTTLRMIAGLETPDAGRILVDGRDVARLPPHQRNMGVVFQSYALFPHMTAAENIAFGLRMRGVKARERVRRAAAALSMVGLPGRGEAKPGQLSGGQQQRVALARALAIEPDVLLLDEPLSALDAKLREELRQEMRAIQKRSGATSVFVTHDQAEALAMADLVAVMERGRIAQTGTPEEVFERPATAFVAEFVGRSARFAAQWSAAGLLAGGTLLRTLRAPACGAPRSGAARVFVRPHRIAWLAPYEAADNCLEGRTASIDYAGETAHLAVDTALGSVPVEIATRDGSWRSLAVGQSIRIGWSAADTLWFPA